MKIQIAGPGCPECAALEKNVSAACNELGMSADIAHVFDIGESVKLGVSTTPALIVDGKILMSGKVPTVEELKRLLSDMDKMHHTVSGWEED